jgi:phosphate/phosphite/phosphonate ABC transporter binding protein
MRLLSRLELYQWLLGLPLLLMLSWSWALASSQEDGTIHIGVLAKRGDAHTIDRWKPTAEYLSHEIPNHRFVVVPLNFVEVDQVVAKDGVDFILANPAIYVGLEKRYGAGRIATLRNRNGHRGYTYFGGVIFTRSERTDINKLTDLAGKRFAAVKENSFGGYLMALRELVEAGVTPSEDTSLQFSGTHDAVVYAVLAGKADAGTVRTDTLERMSDEGKIDLAKIKLLNAQHRDDFGYLLSTRLYPEWPIARLAHTDDQLSHDVAVALLRMPPDSRAARIGQTAGWTVPGNYQPVHELLRELRIDPYSELGQITFTDLLRNYWYWLLLILLALLLLSTATGYVSRLNLRLRQTEGELRSARDNLLEKVRERTAELEQSHQRLARISRDWNDAFDAINDPIFIHDTEMCIVQANPSYCQRAGHDLEQMLGKPYYNYFPPMDAPLPGCTHFPDHDQADESELRLDSGEVFLSRSYGIKRSDNTILHAIHILEDVTEQRHAEIEMQRLNRALLTLSRCNTTLVHAEHENELMDDISHILIEQGGYCFAWIGYVDTHEECNIRPVAYAGQGGQFLQQLDNADTDKGSDALALHALQQSDAVILRDLSVAEEQLTAWCGIALESGFSSAIALPLASQGEVFGVLSIFAGEVDAFDKSEIALLREMAGDLSFGIHTLRNQMEHARAERELHRSEERYQELYENAPSAYLSVSAYDGSLMQFNHALCEMLGYNRETMATKSIFELYADTADGKEKVKTIFAKLRDGSGVRDEELQMLHSSGETVWVSLTVEPVFDADGRIAETRSMMIDISDRKYAEEERSHFAEQLQRSLLQTIRAIALTIEKRDPYTAGHQERVADLAVKIGQEMGLDADDLEGIKLGALIHDIGKISIPAEILSRPGVLGPEMFNIIKTHPRSGYEIIGGIDFPWPLAEVVLQHHERMDGSGYPNGLKGDEILFEARIMAVADVVEAMASHRPYRAGLGLKQALEEIERGKGSLYDTQVVDACLKVFSDEDEMAGWVRSAQQR